MVNDQKSQTKKKSSTDEIFLGLLGAGHTALTLSLLKRVKAQGVENDNLEDSLANLAANLPSNKGFLPKEPISAGRLLELHNSDGLNRGWIETYIILPTVLQMLDARSVGDDLARQRSLAVLRQIANPWAEGLGRRLDIQVRDGEMVTNSLSEIAPLVKYWETTVHDNATGSRPYLDYWSYSALKLFTHPRMQDVYAAMGVISDGSNVDLEQYILDNNQINVHKVFQFLLDAEDYEDATPYLDNYDISIWFNEVNGAYHISYKKV